MSADPYETIAPRYDRWIEPLNHKLKALALRSCPPEPGLRVLDIGCGTGTLLERYREGGARVAGVDASPAMLARARARLGEGAWLVLADAANAPFGDGVFDLITITMVLHELPPWRRDELLREARRALAPRGRLLLVDFHDGPLRFPRGWWLRLTTMAVERAAGRDHFAGYRHFVTHGALPRLADNHGFRVESRRVLGQGNMALMVLR